MKKIPQKAKRLNETKAQETKKNTQRNNILFKLLDLKEENYKSSQRAKKGHLMDTGTKIKVIVDFSLETTQMKR